MAHSTRRLGSKSTPMVMLVLLAASGALAQAGADSPQALLAAAQKAAAERDAVALVRLIAPSQLHILATETDMAAELMSELAEGDGAERLASALAKLREEYGVDPDAASDQPPLEVGPETTQEVIDAHIDARARRLYADVDLAGYLGELTALLVSTPEMAEQPLFPPGQIGDVKVDGDRATAQVGEEEIELVREEDRWYIAQPG